MAGLTERAIRNKVERKRLAPPLKKSDSNRIIGWELSYLKSHPDFLYWLEHYEPKKKKDKQLKKNKCKKYKLIRASRYNENPINCSIFKPCYETILNKLIPDLEYLLKSLCMPIGGVLVFKYPDKTPYLLKTLKKRIAKEFKLKDSDIYHWHKKEIGEDTGEHSHIVILFDAQRTPNRTGQRLKEIIDQFGDSIWANHTNSYRKKSIHVISNIEDTKNFIYHASYLAKSKTAKNGNPSFSRSRNLTNKNAIKQYNQSK